MSSGCVMPAGAEPPKGSSCALALSSMRAFYRALPMCGASEATLRAVMSRYFSETTLQHWSGGANGGDSVGREAICEEGGRARRRAQRATNTRTLARRESPPPATRPPAAPPPGRAMLPLLRAYPGAVFREIAAFWDEPTGTAVLLMEAVGSQNGGLYGVIPATGKTTCVPLFEAGRVGPDGKFSELWTCLGALRERGGRARGGGARARLRALGGAARERARRAPTSPPPAARGPRRQVHAHRPDWRH